MADLILYSYFRSSTSYRVRMALNWKGLKYEYKPVHLLQGGGEQHQPSYRAINPIGGVPSLVHGEAVIAQSRAIIEYLDTVFPQNSLYPSNALDRAHVSQICDNINCELHPLGNLRVMQYLEKNLHIDEAKRQQWIHHWNRLGLEATEKIVQKTAGTYAVGSTLTAADIFIVAHLFSANRFAVPLDNYPTLVRINETCLKLKQFQDSHPHRQPDTPSDLKI